VVQAPPRARANGASAASTARPGEAKVDPAAQRARDSDARRILTDELKSEEERLAALQKEYNNGEPERKGDERNFQKYTDRVADMKAAITRKEADIAALKRELAKLPQ
jgi:chromosome segregation ATPase